MLELDRRSEVGEKGFIQSEVQSREGKRDTCEMKLREAISTLRLHKLLTFAVLQNLLSLQLSRG